MFTVGWDNQVTSSKLQRLCEMLSRYWKVLYRKFSQKFSPGVTLKEGSAAASMAFCQCLPLCHLCPHPSRLWNLHFIEAYLLKGHLSYYRYLIKRVKTKFLVASLSMELTFFHIPTSKLSGQLRIKYVSQHPFPTIIWIYHLLWYMTCPCMFKLLHTAEF